MCYSALVAQHVKKLGLKYNARIQLDAFEELFRLRLEGSGAKISLAMENAFLEDPTSPEEKQIAKHIQTWRTEQITKFEQDLFTQKKRLADAERTLLTKVTKKAQTDQRVATNKIEDFKRKLEQLKTGGPREDYSRIFSGIYAPLILMEDGELVIRPFRYHLRPAGQKPSYDRQYPGTYNARRDNLEGKFWNPIFGKKHGAIEMKAFWENVCRHDYEKRALGPDEPIENMVLNFTPRSLDAMLAPCIFDRNEEDEFPLESFALLTDDPNPEVAETGHERTPIIMKSEYLGQWLDTRGEDRTRFAKIWLDKQSTYFEHRVAA